MFFLCENEFILFINATRSIMFRKLSLTAFLMSAAVICAAALPAREAVRASDRTVPRHGVRLTPEQRKVVEAVTPGRRTPSLPVAGHPATARLGRHANHQSPLLANATGSHIQGWRTSDSFAYYSSGWYDLGLDGTETLLWEYEDPDWVDDGYSDGPTFPFNTGFIRDGDVFGFHGEILFYWLVWGYGTFSLDGQDVEYHEYGDDFSVTDFSTYVISCAYDSSEDKAYAYTLNSEASGYMLQRIDLGSMKFTPIADNVPLENICIGFTYNSVDGRLYGFTPDSRFVTVDPATGDQTRVAKLDLAVTTLAQGLVYSPLDKAFVFVYSDGNGSSELYTITPGGEAEYQASLYDAVQYSILVCTDRVMEGGSPNAPELVSIDFAAGSLSGSASVTLPVRTFDGSALTGSLTLAAYIDGERHATVAGVAGSTVDVTFDNVPEGNHTFSFTAVSGDLEGASADKMLYVGYDTPYAPSNVVFSDCVLTWDAPTAGLNNGYIDADALVYNVYVNGEKYNDQPVSACRLEIDLPDAEYQKYVAQVEAVNHGHISDRAFSNDFKYGRPFPLPYTAAPTSAEGELMETVVPRGRGWFSSDADGYYYMFYTFGYTEDDYWLILPAVELPETENLIEISFEVRVDDDWGDPAEYVAVAGASEQDCGQMSIIKEWPLVEDTEWRKMSAWCISKPGTYYFAIKTRCHEDGSYLAVRNIRVAVSDRPATVPVEVGDLTVTAHDMGELKARVSFTMPLMSMDGGSLAGRQLTAVVSSEVESKSVTGVAGSGMAVDIATPEGWSQVTVSASNEGEGMPATEKVFTGVDVPEPLDGIAVSHSADYKTLHLEWEAPQSGYNGGYIDPSAVTYSLCLYNADTYGWEIAEDLGNVLSYDYTPEVASGLELVDDVAILTRNGKGDCGVVLSVSSPAGTPYGLPVLAVFDDDYELNPDYTPLVNEQPDEDYTYGWGWGYVASAYPYWVSQPTPYGDGAYVASGNAGEKARVSLPAFSSVGANAVSIEFPAWHGPSAGEIRVYAEAFGMDAEQIGSFADASEEGWKKVRFAIPEKFMGKEWVSLKIDASFTCDDATAGFGQFKIMTFYDNDVAVAEIDAPSFPLIGEEAGISAVIENVGNKEAGRPQVELVVEKDGRELAVLPMATTDGALSLPVLETARYSAEWIPDGESEGEVTYLVRIVGRDMDASNDELSAEGVVSRGNTPVVSDLKAVKDDDGNVLLSWTAPQMPCSGSESFENFSPYYFGDVIGDFKNVNLDGYESNYFGGFRFPHDSDVKGWQVLDVNGLNDIFEEVGYDFRLSASTGDKVVAAFCPLSYYVGEEKIADRWLISPELRPGSTFSFMMTSGLDGFFEKMEVLYSATDDEPGSFTSLYSTHILSPTWHEYSYVLPDDAKYAAVRYCGTSETGFFVMMDDIEYEPAAEAGVVDGYDIWRDGATVCEYVRVQDSWADSYEDAGQSTFYNIVPVIRRDDAVTRGMMSNTAYVGVSSVDDLVSGSVDVTGGEGFIMVTGGEGLMVNVYALDGRMPVSDRCVSDVARYGVTSGVYLVKVGSQVFKVLVR